jgi:hypothetical protein
MLHEIVAIASTMAESQPKKVFHDVVDHHHVSSFHK